MNNTENSPFTNFLGVAVCMLAMAGQITRWWSITDFVGTWYEIVLTFLTGMVLILGMSDEFISEFFKKFKRNKTPDLRSRDDI
jgi:hypothetical protein